MLRRAPTRTELKLDDLQEYENFRKEQDGKTSKSKTTTTTAAEPIIPPTVGLPTIPSRQEIQDRIGYLPLPRLND